MVISRPSGRVHQAVWRPVERLRPRFELSSIKMASNSSMDTPLCSMCWMFPRGSSSSSHAIKASSNMLVPAPRPGISNSDAAIVIVIDLDLKVKSKFEPGPNFYLSASRLRHSCKPWRYAAARLALWQRGRRSSGPLWPACPSNGSITNSCRLFP
jgi:hypothetical protein